MKKNDIAVLILVISISIITTYFIGKAIVGEPKDNPVKVERVEKISAEITDPDESIFNAQAINPTVYIQIGQPSNQQPFNNN